MKSTCLKKNLYYVSLEIIKTSEKVKFKRAEDSIIKKKKRYCAEER